MSGSNHNHNQDGGQQQQNKKRSRSNALLFLPTRMRVLVLFSMAVTFYAGLIMGGAGTCSLPSSSQSQQSQCHCNTRTSTTDQHNDMPERTTTTTKNHQEGVVPPNPQLEGGPPSSLNTEDTENEELTMIQERIINKEVYRRTKLAETAHFQSRVKSEVSKMKQELNDRKKKEISSLKQKIRLFQETVTNTNTNGNGTSSSSSSSRQKLLFDRSMSDFVVGATRVNRDDFAAKYVLLLFCVVCCLVRFVHSFSAGLDCFLFFCQTDLFRLPSFIK
jgi:hypothetical protein